MSHTCHAIDCYAGTPPKLFMCAKHWRMVPQHMKDAIWTNYRPGQERDKSPSRAYLEAAREARQAVRQIEQEETAS